MIKLSDNHAVKIDRNSSKGNQLKWKMENTWYKADRLGYESLAEYVVSALLEKTTVTDFVRYNVTKVDYNGYIYNGCYSTNFLKPTEMLITLPRLFQMYLNEDIYMVCDNPLFSEADCAKYITDQVEQITGITNFGEYLTLMLEMDAFFLNEDRHLNNIAVIYDEEVEQFRCCPIFDNGGSLFSDTMISFGSEKTIEECRAIIMARPFSPSFDDQISAVESLYGSQFQYWFTEKDIQTILENVQLKEMYPEDNIKRIKDVLFEQMHIYERFQRKGLDEKIKNKKHELEKKTTNANSKELER